MAMGRVSIYYFKLVKLGIRSDRRRIQTRAGLPSAGPNLNLFDFLFKFCVETDIYESMASW